VTMCLTLIHGLPLLEHGLKSSCFSGSLPRRDKAGLGRPEAAASSASGRLEPGTGGGPGRPEAGPGGGPGRTDPGLGGGPGRTDAGPGGGPGRSDAGPGGGPGRKEAVPLAIRLADGSQTLHRENPFRDAILGLGKY
jgi:hypothetical protein